MNFWWVNHKQTFRQEFFGKYIWSPKRKRNDQINPFYETMREVAPGDIVYSFADGAIQGFGMAQTHCYTSPRPDEFGHIGLAWNEVGWRVDIDFQPFTDPILPTQHMHVMAPTLPERYSPIRQNGYGNQGVYLAEIPRPMALVIAQLASPELLGIIQGIRLAETAETSLPELRGVVEWEERECTRISENHQLRDTEKQALIKARRGQGLFRQNVAHIERCCRITRVDRPEHLVASHIKPWRESDNHERLFEGNGLLLGAQGFRFVGIVLSHRIEPDIRVEKMMLATNTPTLRISPETPGPHPIALLVHGNGGSKEMLFRFGEALATAGFDCYSVDLAGYGASPLSCSLTNIDRNFREAYRALGTVDVFIGHSLGGGVGGWSVNKAGFRPKLFIGVGAPVEFGEHTPPALFFFSRLDEFRPMIGTWLKAQTNAQVVFSPWGEHITEVFDPFLVGAAVKAACAAVSKPVPAPPTACRWRFAGLVLGMAGALVLMFRLPELHPRLAQTRRFIIPAVLLIAVILTMGSWIGVTPQLRRLPQQLILFVFIRLALSGLSRLRLPRWSLAVVTGILALGCLAVAFSTHIFLFATLMCTFAISTLLLLPSTLVGRIAALGGSRRDGDIAMAIFASYVIGQFMPLSY